MAEDRLPLHTNIRWFQLAFGAFVGILLWRFFQHWRGAAPLDGASLALHAIGLVVGTLVFAIYLQNVHRHGLVPDYSLKCRFCNGPVNRYSEFCEHCGADLIAEEKLTPCSKCGVELYEGTKHCPECGALVAKPKGKGKKNKPAPEPEPEPGWDTPIDANTGLPWERRD